MNDVWPLVTAFLEPRQQIRMLGVCKELSRAITPNIPRVAKGRATCEQIMTTWSPLALHVLQRRNPWSVLRALQFVRPSEGEFSSIFILCASYHFVHSTCQTNAWKRTRYGKKLAYVLQASYRGEYSPLCIVKLTYDGISIMFQELKHIDCSGEWEKRPIEYFPYHNEITFLIKLS